MATIKNVASRAGVSVATVSRVINNNGYIARNTLDKVNSAIKELNYIPNEVARSLYQKRSKLVGLILPDISNPFFSAISKGVSDKLDEHGYTLVLGNTGGSDEKKLSFIHTFAQNNIAGIITTGDGFENGSLKKLQKEINVPIVFLDRANNKKEYAVFSDDYLGGSLQAKAILETDPKHIILIKGPEGISTAQLRFNGAYDVLMENNIDFDVEVVKSFEAEDDISEYLFEKYQIIDSIIAPNDMHAIAILRNALSKGKNVPVDFQIIGYDDIGFCKMVYPTLTTVSQPAYEIGFLSAEIIAGRIGGEKIENTLIKLPVELKRRNSTR